MASSCFGVVAVLASQLGVKPPQGTVPIAWRGYPDGENEPFRSFPAHLVPLMPSAWFKDKIVLIGSDLTLVDRHRTPFATLAHKAKGLSRYGKPGVMIHSHTLAQMLDGRSPPGLGNKAQIFLVLLASLAGLALTLIPLGIVVQAVIVACIVPLFWWSGFLIFGQGGPLIPLVAPSVSFCSLLLAANLSTGQQERKQETFF